MPAFAYDEIAISGSFVRIPRSGICSIGPDPCDFVTLTDI